MVIGTHRCIRARGEGEGDDDGVGGEAHEILLIAMSG